MQHIPNQKAESMNEVAEAAIDKKATVISDNFKSFSQLKNYVKEHAAFNVPAKEASTVLPWLHVAISNLKRELLGKYHSVKKDYLQNYLNEFCYKTNRRAFGRQLFDRLWLQPSLPIGTHPNLIISDSHIQLRVIVLFLQL